MFLNQNVSQVTSTHFRRNGELYKHVFYFVIRLLEIAILSETCYSTVSEDAPDYCIFEFV